MDGSQEFFLGFVIAGLFGWLSSLLLKSWEAVGKTHKQMFSDVPQPVLKPLPRSSHKSIGVNPNRSPIQILRDGCLKIIGQGLLQIMLLTAISVLILFTLHLESSSAFPVGIVFAAVIGFLLQNLRRNWKKISDLHKMIVNPPEPVLSKAASPNKHYLAAKPPFPPFFIVANNTIEISLRLILQLILFYFLYQSISAAYFYLSDGIIRFSPVGAFGT